MKYNDFLDKKVTQALKRFTKDDKFPYRLSTENITEEVITIYDEEQLNELLLPFRSMLTSVGRSMLRLGYTKHRTNKQRYWIVFEILE